MFNKIGQIGIALLIASLALTGCTKPMQPEMPTMAPVRIDQPTDYDRLWDNVVETMLQYRFELDRRDRALGVIDTEPMTSAHFVEFWRYQSQTPYYWWENNIDTIQRKVTARIESGEPDDTCTLAIEVERYRYNLEERQIDNSAAALRLFSGAAPTASGKIAPADKSGYWIRLGRDEPMERLLLDTILENYDLTGPPVVTQPAE